MDYSEVKALLNKYFEGNSSVKEEALLRDYFTQNETIPSELMYAKAMFGYFKSDKYLHLDEKGRSSLRRPIIRILTVAASIAVILILGVTFLLQGTNNNFISNWFGSTIMVSNESSEIIKILLADNNIIWLNRSCEVIYPKKSGKRTETIKLSGEAYFEIRNSEINYNIIAHNVIIEAETASSFSVKSLANQECVEIAVNSGAVRVLEADHIDGLSVLVTEGNYCSVHKYQKLIFAAANKNENYFAWITGNLVFDNSYMATVTDVLSRYYDIKFEFEDKSLAYCKFSGVFINKPIDYILSQIRKDLNVEIDKTDELIRLSGDGCKEFNN